MELALEKCCYRALVRLLTLPSAHPLHKAMRKARQNPPKRHHSPLDRLLLQFNINNERIETISPAAGLPTQTKMFRTRIAATREESIQEEHLD
jgi:hypothetical protein